MKSLYSVLGVSSDASSAQIESAYAEAIERLRGTATSAGVVDVRAQFVALKEAYSVLSDPGKRRLYNEKLFAPEAVARRERLPEVSTITVVESSGHRKLLLLGLLVLGGIGIYLYNAHENEALRLQHEEKVRAAELNEKAQQQAAADSQARLDRQKELDAKADTARQAQQAALQRQQDARDDAMRAQQERAAATQAQIDQKKQQIEYQQRLAREKALLQSLEIEHYGQVITH